MSFSVAAASPRERRDRICASGSCGSELQQTSAASLYRFKKEFRALAGVAHRNLVQLYELVAREGIWFFTMELVDGCDFLQFVRPGHASSAARGSSVLATPRMRSWRSRQKL